jgi:capsular polysaccharide transport system permease protein
MDQEVRTADQTAPTTDRTTLTVDQDSRSFQKSRWLKRHIVFVVTVLVPTLAAIVYFSLIASDVYTSESRFLVRSPQKPASTGFLGDFLQGTGFSRSQDDTYTVRDFILSRDAMKELDDKLGIRKSYSSGRVDRFNRFPGFDWDASFEAFYRYYGKQVTVDYDPVSSISILTVQAFTAEDAQKINQMLLEMSERLINSLNDRSRHDLVQFADEEVKVAAAQAREASMALLAFRSKQSVFEPDKQATIQLEGVAKLEEELVSTEAELAQLKKLSPNNPQIIGLNSRAETLRAAIASEASKVTSGTGSLSVHASAFERLALDSGFADKQLGVALAARESSRSEAVRKQLYLERLVQPNLPDKAMQPKRIRSVFTVFVLGLILWGVTTLVLASIREHAD